MKTMNRAEQHKVEEFDEDDEETRDFYIYILSREHPTVLTPVANPYKRSDKIKEANTQLFSEPPVQTKSYFKLRFSDTPVFHEYIKEEDTLSQSSSSSPESSPVNELGRKTQEFHNPVSSAKKSNDETNLKKNHLVNSVNVRDNKQSNKENIKFTNLEQLEIKSDDPTEKHKTGKLKSPNKKLIGIIQESEQKHHLSISNDTPDHVDFKKPNAITNEILETSQSLMESLSKEIDSNKGNLNSSRINANRFGKTSNEKKTVISHIDINDEKIICDVQTEGGEFIKEEKQSEKRNEQSIETITDANVNINNKLNETDNTVKIKEEAIENLLSSNTLHKERKSNVNDETKLNYRPSSTERSSNKYSRINSVNGLKNKTTSEKEEEKHQVNMTSNTNSNVLKNKTVTNKKNNINANNKNKSLLMKSEIPTEVPTKSNNKSQIMRSTKNETGDKSASKDKYKGKIIENKINDSTAQKKLEAQAEIEHSVNPNVSSIEVKEKSISEIVKQVEWIESTSSKNENLKIKIKKEENIDLELTATEAKAKIKELKERNRSKLVVLVPPFEQYKSYMNDNYSDSDNESLDLEEFLRRENENDFYSPDFEIESDHEINGSLSDIKDHLDDIEHKLTKTKFPDHKKRNKSATQSDRKSRTIHEQRKRNGKSIEEEELIRHRCKMMDNIKNSHHFESMRKLNQDLGEVNCKQKCFLRPSTAPVGRKNGCGCKWPRIKLPEYNGLRSEYGLSAEQLCERKRQKQEIAKRMKERKQRRLDEEEKRKMENQQMFHEWLLKKRQQAKEQWIRNQKLRSMRYSRQCITPNQKPTKCHSNKMSTTLNIRKKLHPGRNCFSLDEMINDVNLNHDENNSYKIYLGLSIE